MAAIPFQSGGSLHKQTVLSFTHMVLCSALIKVAPPLLGSRSTAAHEIRSNCSTLILSPVNKSQNQLIFQTVYIELSLEWRNILDILKQLHQSTT